MVLPADVLDPAVPRNVVETVITETWRAWKRCDYRLALALRRLLEMNAHRGHGVSDFGDWVEFRWGMPRKLVWTFAYLGKHLKRLPELRRAMEEERVCYTKAREFAAVAEPEDVEWWIDFADSHSYREVRRELERSRARKQGKEYVPKKVVTSELDPEQAQTARVLKVIGRAQFEKYYLKDGTFLGVGYDCAPFEQPFPHVGKTGDEGRVAERAPPEWFGRRKSPA